MLLRRKPWLRKGLGTTETVCVIAGLVLAALIGMAALGKRTVNEMNSTAEDVATPSELADRFNHD